MAVEAGEYRMSFEERAPIAAALSEVPGVKGYAYRPRAPKTGDGWPRWMGVEILSTGTSVTAWQVIVLVPTDEAAQETWIGERLQAFVDALSDIVWVINIEPGVSNDSPALLLNCREG